MSRILVDRKDSDEKSLSTAELEAALRLMLLVRDLTLRDQDMKRNCRPSPLTGHRRHEEAIYDQPTRLNLGYSRRTRYDGNLDARTS